MTPPPKWKMAILIWVAIYPSITLLNLLFGQWLNQINPMPLRTMVVTLILVPLMVFILLPLLNGLFKNWLHKN